MQRTNYTTKYYSEPIKNLKWIFYVDVIVTIITIFHWFLFWLSYNVGFSFRMFLGILAMIFTVGLCVYQFFKLYKEMISGRLLDLNLLTIIRCAVWLYVFIYCLVILIWIASSLTVGPLNFGFKFGYFLMFVMMVSSVVLLAVTALYMKNIKLHNLSLTRGNITHVVQQ